MPETKDFFVQLSIDCRRAERDAIVTVLEDSGALSVSIEDSVADRTALSGLFMPDETSLKGIRSRLVPFRRTDLDFQIEQTTLVDRDWVAQSQQNFEPIEVSSRLRIVAPWHELHSDESPAVVINPGQSFGTGHHATTMMCLRYLSALELNGCTVLDYGCGSGILAISALVLGANFAWGVDIDGDALDDSRDNAHRNGVIDRYRATSPERLQERLCADVVVANLFAGALESLSAELIARTRNDGYLILSGLLDSQVRRVCEHYSSEIEFTVEHQQDWCMLAGRKPLLRSAP